MQKRSCVRGSKELILLKYPARARPGVAGPEREARHTGWGMAAQWEGVGMLPRATLAARWAHSATVLARGKTTTTSKCSWTSTKLTVFY